MIYFKSHELLVDEKDVIKTLDAINDVVWNSRLAFIKGIDLRVGRCGWKKAPSCWFIRINVTDKTWAKILEQIAKLEIELLPETTGY